MMIFKSFIFPNIYHDMHANDRFCLEVNISTCYPEFQQPFEHTNNAIHCFSKILLLKIIPTHFILPFSNITNDYDFRV